VRLGVYVGTRERISKRAPSTIRTSLANRRVATRSPFDYLGIIHTEFRQDRDSRVQLPRRAGMRCIVPADLCRCFITLVAKGKRMAKRYRWS
jgi:hypothetical protein